MTSALQTLAAGLPERASSACGRFPFLISVWAGRSRGDFLISVEDWAAEGEAVKRRPTQQSRAPPRFLNVLLIGVIHLPSRLSTWRDLNQMFAESKALWGQGRSASGLLPPKLSCFRGSEVLDKLIGNRRKCLLAAPVQGMRRPGADCSPPRGIPGEGHAKVLL